MENGTQTSHPRPRRGCTNRTVFDRFIPYRPCLNVDASYSKILAHHDNSPRRPAQHRDPKARYYNKLLDAVFRTCDQRILPTSQRHDSGFSSPMSPNRSFFDPFMDDVFATPSRRRKRYVSKSPISVLDLPKLRNDIHTNNLDWGHSNKIAVAVRLTAYVWDAHSRVCQQIRLVTPRPALDYISSLAWDPRGTQLVIGDNRGDITVCDIEKVVSNYETHLKEQTAVTIVRWTDQGIFSGSEWGTIYQYDPRVKTPVARLITGHSEHSEVCGLAHAEGTPYIASGTGDGEICIWDVRSSKFYKTFQAHSSFTKALAWCPWRKNVLASGGGSCDGNIRLWNMHTCRMIGEVSTLSQTFGLIWSEEHRELASTHGLAKVKDNETNDIIIWAVRDFQFEPIARLHQHTDRPLHLAISPDKTHLASAGADEILCLWHSFPRSAKEEQVPTVPTSPLSLDGHIR